MPSGRWAVDRGAGTLGPILIYACCIRNVFQCLNTSLVGSTSTKMYVNFMDIYSFIPAIGCVGIIQVHCCAPGPIILLRWPWLVIYINIYLQL